MTYKLLSFFSKATYLQHKKLSIKIIDPVDLQISAVIGWFWSEDKESQIHFPALDWLWQLSGRFNALVDWPQYPNLTSLMILISYLTQKKNCRLPGSFHCLTHQTHFNYPCLSKRFSDWFFLNKNCDVPISFTEQAAWLAQYFADRFFV